MRARKQGGGALRNFTVRGGGGIHIYTVKTEIDHVPVREGRVWRRTAVSQSQFRTIKEEASVRGYNKNEFVEMTRRQVLIKSYQRSFTNKARLQSNESSSGGYASPGV